MGAETPREFGNVHGLGACGAVTSITFTRRACRGMVCRMRRIVPSSRASSAIIALGM